MQRAKIVIAGATGFIGRWLIETLIQDYDIIALSRGQEERSNFDRHLFFITGGLLCQRKDLGWLEFRQINQKKWTISAIHEFVPTLPWWLYRLTQAPLHSFVMKQFGKHLARLSLSGKIF